MNLEELRRQAMEKRQKALDLLWAEKNKAQSPPCEQCGKAKKKVKPRG